MAPYPENKNDKLDFQLTYISVVFCFETLKTYK